MSQHDNITIAIIDDHPIVIEGIKALLVSEPYMQILSFTTGESILEFIKNNEVNIALLDIMLPDIHGIEVCREIKKVSPQTLVLALSNQAERSIIMQMLQNGASGYILKNAGADELLDCIHEAMKGNLAFSKEVKEIMAKPSQRALQAFPFLTKREKQILQMIANGDTTQQIAQNLYLSPFTVETHRRNLLQKMEVKNVAELIRTAIEQKLL